MITGIAVDTIGLIQRCQQKHDQDARQRDPAFGVGEMGGGQR
jgi:hypothetical protein